MKVEVTQQDIDQANAKRGTESYDVCSDCAVALAFKRTVGDDKATWSYFLGMLDKEDELNVWRVSEDGRISEVNNWVKRFDDQLPVEPITFEVEQVA